MESTSDSQSIVQEQPKITTEKLPYKTYKEYFDDSYKVLTFNY